MMRSRPGRVVVGALLLAGAGCASAVQPPPTLGEGDPTSVGPIVARDVGSPSSGDLPTLHVRASGDDCGIIYSVSPGTPIRRRNDRGSFDELSLDALRVGVTVAVWTDVVLQSCPGQAGAHAIEVL